MPKKRLLPYQIFTWSVREAMAKKHNRGIWKSLAESQRGFAGGRRHNKYGKIILHTLQNADKIEGFDIAESDNEGVDIRQ